MKGLERPTRVELVQPALARYRLAPFAELAARPNVDLHVHYGHDVDLPPVQPEGFDASPAPLKRMRFAGRTVTWHPRQWEVAVGGRHRRVAMLLWDVQYATLVPALLRARRNGVGTVLWGHGYGKQEARWRRTIRTAVARLADAVLVYDPLTAARLIDEDGFSAEQVHVARNTLDVREAHAAAENVDDDTLNAHRRQLGLPADRTFLLVSRPAPTRRADLLVDAARQVDGARVVLIGDGWREWVMANVADPLQRERIITPGPVYDEAALALWFAASAAVVLPEEAGLAVVHAMAHRRPIITHDDLKSHAPEAVNIVEGETGLLYRRGDVCDLARCLRRLVDEPELGRRLGKTASERARDELSVSRMVDGMIGAIATAARDV